ncbi:hypothetical protein D3C72_1171430 [compost metagenome]
MDVRNQVSKILVLFFISLLSFSFSFASSGTKNQLEDLFIWKMSEELKLTSLEEKKFTETVKNLNQKKADLNKDLQEALVSMTKAETDKQKADQLKTYKRSLHAYNLLSEEEIEKIQGMLGATRTVQYLQIKQDLTNRIKTMLMTPDASKPKPLPAPKVIEEK